MMTSLKMLLNYKEHAKEKHILDGRYFNMVMGQYKQWIDVPLIIVFKDGEVHDNADNVKERIALSRAHSVVNPILRIIVHIDSKIHHSMLLIVNDYTKIVNVFDPSSTILTDEQRDIILKHSIAAIFDGYTIKMLDIHPQDDIENKGLCTAYTLKYAYYVVNYMEPTFDGYDDIVKFALAVENLYGPPVGDMADIEYGILSGAIAGGLLGGLFGGREAVVPGALGGAFIGSIARPGKL